MNWYFQVLKKYAVFSGRAPRKEFWYFLLFNYLSLIMLGIIIGDVIRPSPQVEMALLYVILVYTLAVLIPGVAVGVRRLHDTGRGGWWFLIAFLPFGAIVLLVFLGQDSQRGENQYGPDPIESLKIT